MDMRHSRVLPCRCCQQIPGNSPPFCRHCAYAVDPSLNDQTTISQPRELPQIFVDAAYAVHYASTSLPRRPLELGATRANKAADKQEPADRPNLLPSTPTYLQNPPYKRQPTHCEVIQAWAPSYSDKERLSCLKQQDGDVAQIGTTCEQKCTNALSDATCAMCSTLQQPGIVLSKGQSTDSCHRTKLQSRAMKQSSKRALRTPSGRAPRKQEASGSSRLSLDCTAILHTAGAQATGETFSLHAWCASIDAASSVPTERHTIKDVYASQKTALRNTIVQFAANAQNPHGESCRSRKRRKLMSGH